MDHRSTVAVRCNTQRILFACEYNLRAEAKRESEFDREVWLFHCAILTQKDRFRHEASCPVCLAAEKAFN